MCEFFFEDHFLFHFFVILQIENNDNYETRKTDL